MKKHHTKTKGDLGVLKVQVDLAEKDWLPCLPLTEHAPFDLIAYKDGKFKRIQVKYRIKNNGCIDVSFKTSWADKKGNHINYYDKTDIDVIAVYCPDTDKCYYIDLNKFSKSISIRLDESNRYKNRKSCNHFSDFENIPD